MLSLAMPVVVAEVGWVAMQIVDISMVGRLGPEAIGAVGVGSALFLALAVVGIGLLLGLDPLVAQAFGARDVGECGAWLRHGLVLAVGLTVPLTVVAWMAATFVSVWGFEPRVLDLTQGYLRVVTWSLLPLLLFTVFRRYVQALGIVRPIMVTLVSANIINAAANWLLVFGNWGFPELGVEGAAWATCVSRTYMCGFLALAVWRVTSRLPHDHSVELLAARGIEIARIRRLMQLGWPAAAQMTLEVGVFAVATALAGRLEAHLLAAHQIVLNTVGLTFMATYGLSAAGAVRVGHAVGRRDLTGARYSGWVALGLGAAFMGVAALAFLTVPQPILRIFTSDGTDPGRCASGTGLALSNRGRAKSGDGRPQRLHGVAINRHGARSYPAEHSPNRLGQAAIVVSGGRWPPDGLQLWDGVSHHDRVTDECQHLSVIQVVADSHHVLGIDATALEPGGQHRAL